MNMPKNQEVTSKDIDGSSQGEEVEGQGAAEVKTDELIQKLQQEKSELEDKYLRLVAEFDNFRKRQERILAELIEQERNNVVGRLLDIADDVARAIESAESGADPRKVLEGIKIISQRISELLRLEGVSAEDPTGKKFDPLEQEAVGIVPVDSPEKDGVVLQAIHPTYKRAGRLVRPAKVFVGKYEEKAAEEENPQDERE